MKREDAQTFLLLPPGERLLPTVVVLDRHGRILAQVPVTDPRFADPSKEEQNLRSLLAPAL